MRIEAGRQRPTGIRLTPLIDVVFILLVFFMLASSFLDWRAFELDVPTDAGAVDDQVEPIRIEIGADGGLWVDGSSVGRDGLVEEVRRIQSAAGQRAPVVIAADDDAPVGSTIEVLDRLQGGGVRGATLGGGNR